MRFGTSGWSKTTDEFNGEHSRNRRAIAVQDGRNGPDDIMRCNLRVAVALLNRNSVAGQTPARLTVSAGFMIPAAAARGFGLNLRLPAVRHSDRNFSRGLGGIAARKQSRVAVEAAFSAMALVATAPDGR
jgi:hypothetical protein